MHVCGCVSQWRVLCNGVGTFARSAPAYARACKPGQPQSGGLACSNRHARMHTCSVRARACACRYMSACRRFLARRQLVPGHAAGPAPPAGGPDRVGGARSCAAAGGCSEDHTRTCGGAPVAEAVCAVCAVCAQHACCVPSSSTNRVRCAQQQHRPSTVCASAAPHAFAGGDGAGKAACRALEVLGTCGAPASCACPPYEVHLSDPASPARSAIPHPCTHHPDGSRECGQQALRPTLPPSLSALPCACRSPSPRCTTCVVQPARLLHPPSCSPAPSPPPLPRAWVPRPLQPRRSVKAAARLLQTARWRSEAAGAPAPRTRTRSCAARRRRARPRQRTWAALQRTWQCAGATRACLGERGGYAAHVVPVMQTVPETRETGAGREGGLYWWPDLVPP